MANTLSIMVLSENFLQETEHSKLFLTTLIISVKVKEHDLA